MDVNTSGPPYEECNDGAVIAKSVGVFDNYYISQLTVTIGEKMINKTIECFRHVYKINRRILIGQESLKITEMSYPPPSNIHVESSLNEIMFAWDEVTKQCSYLRYIITAINCGLCPNTIGYTNITCVQPNISLDTNCAMTCLFAVQTEICGYLVGERSDYVTVHLHHDGKYTANSRLCFNYELIPGRSSKI